MNVSAVGSPVISNPTPIAVKQDLSALNQALENNDLSGAQTAFAQFTQDAAHKQHQGGSINEKRHMEIHQDLQNLKAALDTGDLSGAQAAFAQFKKDARSRLQNPVADSGNTSTVAADADDTTTVPSAFSVQA